MISQVIQRDFAVIPWSLPHDCGDRREGNVRHVCIQRSGELSRKTACRNVVWTVRMDLTKFAKLPLKGASEIKRRKIWLREYLPRLDLIIR